MKKKLITTVLTGCMVVVSTITSLAGSWQQDTTGWWYQNDDGSYPSNVLKQIDGQWYYFDSTGYMKIGNFQFENGWFNFREDGSCSNPISQIDGKPVGAPAEGWVHYGTSTTTAVQGILDGDIIWHNDMCWISQEHFDNLSELATKDIVKVEKTHTLQPNTYVDFSSDSYNDWDEDDE